MCPYSIACSLKEGMFNNANVIFRTKFVDGVSNVTRTANEHRQVGQPLATRFAQRWQEEPFCKHNAGHCYCSLFRLPDNPRGGFDLGGPCNVPRQVGACRNVHGQGQGHRHAVSKP